MIGVGSVASFVSAAFAVRALIRYVSGHNFKVFAWYRIAFGFADSRDLALRMGQVVR